MYEPLNEEPAKSKDAKEREEFATSTLQRETFIENLLTDFMGPQSSKEKDKLCNQLKYKTHQLEVAIKQLKSNRKKSESASKAKSKSKLKCKMRKKYRINRIDTKEKKEFKSFLPMHELWLSYVTKVLSVDKPQFLSEETVLERLRQIDYHGAMIEVVRSKTKGIIGLKGIVIQETKNVFIVVTEGDCLKVIPKEDNLFQIEVLGVKFTLVGSNFCMKPELRCTKCGKAKVTTNLF